MLGDEHPSSLRSMVNLAATFWKQGKLREAEMLELHVVKIRRRILGEDHPETLQSIENLAYTLESQGRRDEAADLMANVERFRSGKLVS